MSKKKKSERAAVFAEGVRRGRAARKVLAEGPRSLAGLLEYVRLVAQGVEILHRLGITVEQGADGVVLGTDDPKVADLLGFEKVKDGLGKGVEEREDDQ